MMIENVLILKNISHEDPGLILDVLNERKINYEMLDFSENDKSEKILKELEIIKSAFKKNIPILGICLGLQLLVKAMNGKVFQNPVKEIGFKHKGEWYKVKLTNSGLTDPLFEGIDTEFIVFQLHGETVELLENIELLGIGKHCRNQIIKIGDFNYGFQFHFEVTESLLKAWIELAPELKEIKSDEVLTNFLQIKEKYTQRGKRIFQNYIRVLGF